MKKLVGTFIVLFCSTVANAQFSGGNGTENNPYIITTAAELAQLATYVNAANEDFNSCYYKLGNDIDLSDYQEGDGWAPIGMNSWTLVYNVFRGVFDGNNKIITGLKINTTWDNDYVGLFGYVYGGTIKNLGIEDADVVRNLNHMSAYAGILAGYISNSSVLNCYTTGTVSASASSVVRTSAAGGIVGEMDNSAIANSFSLATVSAICSSYAYAGGIVGEIDLNSFISISNCYSTGAISVGALNANGNSIAIVGGVAGDIFATELSNCAALNSVINCNSLASNIRSYGRVVGRISSGALVANIAFANMLNPDGNTTWNNQGASNRDGLGFSKEQIHADGTLGGRFTNEGGWTTQNGKLPGLFGNVVQMPEHLRIQGLPYIDTIIIPNGEVGVAYNQILAATGNTPFTWSLESGSLPPGLTFSAAEAIIQGVPTTAGTYNFTIKVSNNLGSDFWNYSLTIFRNLYITTTTLPNGMSGTAYSQTLSATSSTPVTWTIETGELPTGLNLSEEGQITGTPSVSGTFVFTVKAASSWEIDTKDLSLTTKYLFITTENLSGGEVGADFNITLNADGNQPITWELETGILPPGLNISENGVISGVPTTAGQFTFTVKASNELDFDTKLFSLTIIRNLYITTATLPDGEASTNYSQTLSATSNTPVTWTIVSGNLPAGLTLSPEGHIAGIPTTFGTFVFMVKAESLWEIDTKELTLLIKSNPEITTINLPFAVLDYTYHATLEATGNMPIIWSVATGALPTGLSLSETTGIISGMPTTLGDFYFTIKATNNVGSDTQDFVINVIVGDGSETYPYLIATAEELAWLATVVNESNTAYNDKHYKLINDIDLSNYQSGEGWTPIGIFSDDYYNTKSFKGSFDGNNKKITGLKINTTSLRYAGLFGYVYDGTIKNLGVENADIVVFVDEFLNGICAGIVVGYIGGPNYSNSSKLINCYSTGTVSAKTPSPHFYAYAGGIAGYNYGTLSNCYSTASVSANSNSTTHGARAGGIVGYNISSTISNCYSTGTVSANSNYYTYAGGIVGYNHYSTLSNCAALNPKISCTGYIQDFGRVAVNQSGTLASNIAFEDMLNPDGGTTWNNIGASNKDGESIFCEDIHADGTLGGRFTSEQGWTTQNGKLPGLFGSVVNLPQHLWCGTVPPTIITTTLTSGTVNVTYNEIIEATGNEPITWSIETGSLPTGLILNETTGEIWGIPTTEGTFNFTVKAVNNVGSDIKALSIYINTVSVLENEMDSIRIYPNPTTGKLRIESNELRIEEVMIFDIYCRKQKAERGILIDISDLPVGVYFLQIRTEQGEVVKKVLKE